MTAGTAAPAARATRHVAWPRVAAGGTLLAYGAALLAVPRIGGVLAALVVFDVVVMSLPWRLPRSSRGLASVWLETLAYQVAPFGFLAVALADRERWFARGASPWWFAIALATGVGVVALSGIGVRRLLSGELAFVAGPRRPGHAAALAAVPVAAPVAEEAMFRGVALSSFAGATPLALLAAAAFVARHYVPPGAARGARRRDVATRCAAAGALLALTVGSGSLYPALVAHLVGNAPAALLAVQRGLEGRTR